MEFSWDVFHHPPYSPDLALSDFHLFRSLQNGVNGKYYQSLEDIKFHLIEFFQSKEKTFWMNEIIKFHELWAKVIKNNRQCIS